MTTTRRDLLKTSLLATGGVIAGSIGLQSLLRSDEDREITVRMNGPAARQGHRLRDGFQFPEPSEIHRHDVVIVGGGVAGLSAGWRLQKKGVHDFRILELENVVGGNSRSGENAVSKFPWGAHYVTLLSEEADHARELFEDLGIITGRKNGRVIYDEYALCHAPHERLYIYKKWQEGLIPKVGISAEDNEQARSFFNHVESLRMQKGRDGRYAFSIPLDLSSRDPQFLELDRVTMSDYMEKNGWSSKPLHWYVNYCCRDDYGTPHAKTSAWAGLHYFCSRRGRTDGVDGSTVLTWPEGNGWIVDRLHERLREQIVTHAMAIKVEEKSGLVNVDTWNEQTQRVTRWQAKSVILAIPRFLAPHLGPQLAAHQGALARQLSYSPWLVANITLRRLPPSSHDGAALSWDNVLYHGRSLGYVVATHQRSAIHTGPSVWSYYLPLDHLEPAEARKQALATPVETWKKQVISDLAAAHPGIHRCIESIDFWIWGHAMIRPLPGFMWSETRAQMQRNLGRIHFAHSDMSGLSIFEEANYQGVRAADEVIHRVLA